MAQQVAVTTLSFNEIFFGFLVALAAGALIGLEREQSAVLEKKRRLGGVRTFPLIALAGALSALLAHPLGVWPVLGALLVVGAFLAGSYYQERTREGLAGVTTEIAALITFLLGVLALLPGLPLDTIHRYLLIVASAAVVMALLSFKAPLHRAVAHVSEGDLYATAKFVILALVVLPLLPNRTFGPLDVLNPFNIGIMIVLIAGISFIGYIIARILGERKSLAATGILGGLVSSTAVTVSLSARAREAPSTVTMAAVGILAASATMFIRVLLVVGIVDFPLLPLLLLPMGAMAVAVYTAALVFYFGSSMKAADTEPVPYRNPFELRPALQFGLLYALVIVVAKAAQTYLNEPGLYLSSVLAGLADVDAITLSVARFHQEGLATGTAVIAITVAALTNTAVKGGLSCWFGNRPLAAKVLPGLVTAVVAGTVGVLVIW